MKCATQLSSWCVVICCDQEFYSGESMTLKRVIIPYLVLFESSQLLHLFQSRYVLEQRQKVRFQVGGRGQPSQEWLNFQTLLWVIRALSTDNRLKLAFQQSHGF